MTVNNFLGFAVYNVFFRKCLQMREKVVNLLQIVKISPKFARKSSKILKILVKIVKKPGIMTFFGKTAKLCHLCGHYDMS